jgi:biotin transport system substrate-specific component
MYRKRKTYIQSSSPPATSDTFAATQSLKSPKSLAFWSTLVGYLLPTSAARSTLIDYVLPKGASRRTNLLQECLLIFILSACFAVSTRVLFFVGPKLVITLWTLSVLLTGAILGSRRAGLTMLVYLAEGVIGLPVFANLESGGAHLNLFAGSRFFFTEGIAGLDYLIRHSASIELSFPLLACWAFPIAAYVTGLLFERMRDHRFLKLVVVMLPGALIIHSIPVGWSIWLSIIKHLTLATIAASIGDTWPFIFGELFQAVVAAMLIFLVWKLLPQEKQEQVLE